MNGGDLRKGDAVAIGWEIWRSHRPWNGVSGKALDPTKVLECKEDELVKSRYCGAFKYLPEKREAQNDAEGKSIQTQWAPLEKEESAFRRSSSVVRRAVVVKHGGMHDGVRDDTCGRLHFVCHP